MEQNRFYLWIARLNSILLLLLLVIGIGFASFAIFQSNEWTDRNSVEIVDEKDKTVDVENLYLGNINNVCGTNVQYVNLESSSPSKGFSSGGYGRTTRNVIFFVGRQMATHWLFDTNKYLISNIDQLEYMSDECRHSKVAAIYFEIIKKDTNKNDKLESDDHITVSLTTPEGKDYREIEENITSVLDHDINEDGTILTILMQKGKSIFMKKYSVADKKYLTEKELTKIEKKI